MARNTSKKHDNHAPTLPALADWTVTLTDGRRASVKVSQARIRRDARDGYVFSDDQGVKADFPAGAVLHARRIDPEPEPEQEGGE